MFYFDLVNRVLERLRETEVTAMLKNDFRTSSGVSMGTNWDIADGKASHTAGAADNLWVTVAPADATTYVWEVLVSGMDDSLASDYITPEFDGPATDSGDDILHNGLHRFEITTTVGTHTKAQFVASSNFAGSIDAWCIYEKPSDYYDIVRRHVITANTIVEEAFDWEALREAYSFTTADGTAEYTLWGDHGQSAIKTVRDSTNKVFLSQTPLSWYRSQMLYSTTNATPRFFTLNGVDLTGDTKLLLHPTPDDAYTVDIDTFQRTGEHLCLGRQVYVPFQPVFDYAVAYASQERGDSTGGASIELFTAASRTLSDAVARESAKNTLENDWYPI